MIKRGIIIALLICFTGLGANVRKFNGGVNFSSGLDNIISITQQDTGMSVIKSREFAIGPGYLLNNLLGNHNH